jgi:WD40 repeat protein
VGKLPLAADVFLDVAADGQLVVLAPDEKPDDPRRLRFLAADTFKATRSCPVRGSGSYRRMSVRPDGRRVAALLDQGNGLAVWNTDTGKEVLRVPADGNGLYYSGDGKRLAVLEERAVGIYDAETGKKLVSLREREDWPGFPVWSRDGRRLLTAPQPYVVLLHETYVGSVKVWDLGDPRGAEPLTPEYRSLTGHHGWVRALAFSPDGPAAGLGR